VQQKFEGQYRLKKTRYLRSLGLLRASSWRVDGSKYMNSFTILCAKHLTQWRWGFRNRGLLTTRT
jgi:hypothetical protein